MTVYAIAQLTFTNRAAYDRYQARFMEVFAGFEGTLLAADESPLLIEGTGGCDKVVLMSFPDEAEFRRWSESEEYQRISVDRRAGANCVVTLVHGLR